MPTKSAIRRVHAWAAARSAPYFYDRDVTFALMMPRPVVIAVLEELEELGVAHESDSGWRVHGDCEALERALDAMEDATAPPAPDAPLTAIERVRDVFEYAERCALEG